MLSVDTKIARLQDTLRRLEEDVPLLSMRLRDLNPDGREAARRFAAEVMVHARAELDRLMQAKTNQEWLEDLPCEPAD